MSKRVDIGNGATFVGLGDLNDLEWCLRYGDADEVRYVAAEVVACYRQLLKLSQKERNMTCKKIREAYHADSSTD